MRETGTLRLIAALAVAFAGLVPASGLAQTTDVTTLEDSTLEDSTFEDSTFEDPLPVSVGQPQDVALYCAAIRDAAQEARVAWQAQALLEIEARLEARLAELERLRADVEEALARREEHLRQAEEGIVAIYARMRPDAAAAQLAALDSEMASAVLAKLAPRLASAILNEMEPGRAAQLARTATETARDDQPMEQSL